MITTKQDAIAAIYAQVSAPDWAAPNLDGLSDVLRDLSWLPDGPVTVTVPDLAGCAEQERDALLAVLRRVAGETYAGPRPVLVRD